MNDLVIFDNIIIFRQGGLIIFGTTLIGLTHKF